MKQFSLRTRKRATPSLDAFETSAAYRSGEFGVIGAEQPDETAYDKRPPKEVPTSTASRLHFSSDQLYGRQHDLNILDQVYEEINATLHQGDTAVASVRVVVLTGYPGCGKTALVHNFVEQKLSDSPKVLSMRGKYDETTSADTPKIPYAAISQAFEDAAAVWTSTKAQGNIRRVLLEEFVDDMHVVQSTLVKLAPTLGQVLIDHATKTNLSSELPSPVPASDLADCNNKTLWYSCFIRLLECLSRIQKIQVSADSPVPIIFFLDDLQWSDTASIDLIQGALPQLNERPVRVLILLAARSNNTELEHCSWKDFLGELQMDQTTTMLPLKDLSLDATVEFIADTLELSIDTDHEADVDDDADSDTYAENLDVRTLSVWVYERSLGNIFFTKQALEQLARQGALYYDMVLFQWAWKLDQSSSDVSYDLLGLVKAKIESLDKDLQRILWVAANTRSVVQVNVLVSLCRALESIIPLECTRQTSAAFLKSTAAPVEPIGGTEASTEADERLEVFWKECILKLLQQAAAEGLLAQSSSRVDSGYAFAHDRIQEACRNLFPEQAEGKDLTILKNHALFCIGATLASLAEKNNTTEDWMVFKAIHLIAELPKDLYSEREDNQIFLAKLYNKAAQSSMTRAAFSDAVTYASKGISCLPSNRWEDEYRLLSRNLYITAAETSRLCGRIDDMKRYCTICLTAEKERPYCEKFRAYYTLANGLFYGGDRYEEARTLMLNMLHHMGCDFPKTSVGKTWSKLVKLTGLVFTKHKRTQSELARIGIMQDPIKIHCMMLLHKLLEVCYLLNDTKMLPLIIIRGLELTLEYGVSIYSPRMVASVGILFVGVLNDLRGGGLYADYATALMKKVKHKPIEAATVVVTHMFGFVWNAPMRQLCPSLQSAYNAGMNTGDVENAMFCVLYKVWCDALLGKPMPVLDTEMRMYVGKAKEMAIQFARPTLTAMWRIFLGLLGASKNVATLQLSDADKANPLLSECARGFERFELGYLGEYDRCADSILETKDSYRKVELGPFPDNDYFVSTIACVETYRRTRSVAYLKQAKRMRKFIVRRAKQGSPNIQHWVALIDAEFHALRGRCSAAENCFGRALDIAEGGGFVLDSILVNERWANFCWDNVADEEEAQYRLKKALRLCSDIGAIGKSQRLKTRFWKLLSRETGEFSSRSVLPSDAMSASWNGLSM